jgi:hypothetical protein
VTPVYRIALSAAALLDSDLDSEISTLVIISSKQDNGINIQ